MKKVLLILLFLAVGAFAKVNVNNATKEQLMTLKGIGASKADSIIKYRQNNTIKSADDLKAVKGISAGIIKKIKDDIIFDGETLVDTSKKRPSKKMNVVLDKPQKDPKVK